MSERRGQRAPSKVAGWVWETLVEVEPEDAATFRVGEKIFGREIVRIDRERCLIWVRPPGRWHRFRRWLTHLWWRAG